MISWPNVPYEGEIVAIARKNGKSGSSWLETTGKAVVKWKLKITISKPTEWT